MNMRFSCFTAAAALILVTALPAFAAIPATVQLEGVLHSTGGGPAADGVYKLTFAIYDKKADGTAVWKEGPVPVSATNGRFSFELGSVVPIKAAALVALDKQWLGVTVEGETEFARQPLHSVAFALVAGEAAKLGCSGCVEAGHIAKDAIGGAAVSFNYALSDTKGGPALKSKDLACTACVSVDELVFDKDVDLKDKTLTAAKLTSTGDISAKGTVAAAAFQGDGSKLTGIALPKGKCDKEGEVVKGIEADGSLLCVKALDAKNLPGDGLDKISGDTLGNRFDDVIKGGANKDIPDNDSNGLLDIIDVPNVGIAEAIEVYVEVSKAPLVDLNPKDGKPDFDPTDLSVFLFPPTTKDLLPQRSNMVNNFLKTPTIDNTEFPHYILHQGTGAGILALIGTWPTTTKEVAGDIHKDWIGKNPKGKWRLLIIDNKDRPSTTLDGKLVTWHIKVKTLSGNQVNVKGDTFFDGKVWGKYLGHDAKALGDKLVVGGDLQVNGTIIGTINGGIKVGVKPKNDCTAAEKATLRWDNGHGMVVCDGKLWIPALSTPAIFQGGPTSSGGGDAGYYMPFQNISVNTAPHIFTLDGNSKTLSGSGSYGRLYVQADGWYRVHVSKSGRHDYGRAYLYVSGVHVAESRTKVGDNWENHESFTKVLYIKKGQYIQLYVWAGDGSSNNYHTGTGSLNGINYQQYTWMNVEYLGPKDW